MKVKDKEKWRWIFLLAILIFLVCIVDRAISRKITLPTPEIGQGWDNTLKNKVGDILPRLKAFRIPRISIAVQPLSCIYFFAFNHGLPNWLAMIFAYIPIPAIIAIAGFFIGKKQWGKIRERKILKGLTIGIFFLSTVFIVYKCLRRQFDELFFIFTISIFIPIALGSLFIEKKFKQKSH